MRRLVICSLSGLALLSAGCSSSQPIELVLSQESVPADGRDTITFEATVMQGGTPVKDGTAVHFTVDDTSAGTFTQGKSVLKKDGKTVAGVATVDFYPGTTPIEQVVVTASATVNKVNQSDKKNLAITDPTPVSAYYFDFVCNYENVGVFTDTAIGVSEINVPCEVVTKDRNGVDLPNAVVHFKAEAGDVIEVAATSKQARSFYYTYRGSIEPVNVAPSESEIELGLISEECLTKPDSKDCKNPRDRLVTIVAYTQGEEHCEGDLVDGKCPLTVMHWDEGEPFLDVDDDGEYKEEQFTSEPTQRWFNDTNGNGKRDAGNGVWDTNVTIGRFTHILLTGDPTVTITPESYSMCACGQQTFDITIMDEYYNAPAACVSTDSITITPFNFSGAVATGDRGEISLQNKNYMEFGGTKNNFEEPELEGKFSKIVTGTNKELIGRHWSTTIRDEQAHCAQKDDGTPDYSDCTETTTDEDGTEETEILGCKEIKASSVGEFKIKYVYTPLPKVSGVKNLKTVSDESGRLDGSRIDAFNSNNCKQYQ